MECAWPLYTRADGCDTCADTRAIVDDVARLSPHLDVEVHDSRRGRARPGLDHVPSIVVLRRDDEAFVDLGVRLVGAPLEHELTALADAILTVGGAAPAPASAPRAWPAWRR